ncbi:restriction endonuclease subunit S [Rhizobium sp.]|uniref:restriction endonuclease subunit S n=1 Tax=Rhizobium sp. TaxID=391 RepID=UPI0028B0E00F
MSALPRGWAVVEIGNIADIVTGKTPPKSEASFYDGGDVPFFKPGDLTVGGVITTAEDRVNERALGVAPELPIGTVLVSCIGILGKSAIVGRTGTCNQQINAILPSAAATPEFVYLWSRTIKDWLEQNSSATTVSIINKGRFSAAPVPLPPLAEQKRIVAKLDTLNAKSARARTELARIETLVSRYKQAVLSKAFSGDGLGVKVQDKLPLSEVIALRTGPFGSALHKSDYIVGGVPLVNPMHIVRGKIEVDLKTSVATAKAEQLQEFRLKAGDVVLARRGEMGRAAVVGEAEDGYLCGTGSMIVRPSPMLSPIYLQRYLSSPPVVMALESAAVGTTMVNLNQSILLSQTIPLPSIEEQHEIVRRIETAFAKIDRLAKEAKRALELVGLLDEAILAKAFRGELVPQDENDEPAELLLARTRAERQAPPKGKRGRRKES